jgi:hypothetical protein
MISNIRTILFTVGITIIVCLIPICILFYNNYKLKEVISNNSKESNITYKKLNKSLQRAETKIILKEKELSDLTNRYKLDLEIIRTDLKSVGGELEAVGITEAGTTTIVYNNYSSDKTEPIESEVTICKEDGRPIDVHEYTRKIESKKLLDSNGIRVADVSFSASNKNPWSTKVHGLRYRILNTIGRGAQNKIILYTELQIENPEIQPEKVFRIEGIESRILQMPNSENEFNWWDPAIYLIAQLGLNVYNEINFSASLSLGLSIFSYGNDLRFLGITVGYDAFQNKFRVSFVPVLYNIGGPIPFLSDLYLGLDIGTSFTNDLSISFLISTKI